MIALTWLYREGGGCVGSCYMEKVQKSPGPLVLFP